MTQTRPYTGNRSGFSCVYDDPKLHIRQFWADGVCFKRLSGALLDSDPARLPRELRREPPFKPGKLHGDPRAFFPGPWPLAAEHEHEHIANFSKHRSSFNEEMDAILLENGFKYYDNWEYGPQSGWHTSHEHHCLFLMRNGFGYDVVLRNHASGANLAINMGSSNRAEEIIAIRDALKKMW